MKSINKHKYFYHITHIGNIKNILKYGLIPYNKAISLGYIKNDISDPVVKSRRKNKIDPIHNRLLNDYVPLYINPRNPMLYRRRNIQNELIILCINRKKCFTDESIFTDGNAASSNTKFFNTLQDWKMLGENYGKYIWAKSWNSPDENEYQERKRRICAEILIYPKINIDLIEYFVCYNKDTFNTLRDISEDINFRIDFHKRLFF